VRQGDNGTTELQNGTCGKTCASTSLARLRRRSEFAWSITLTTCDSNTARDGRTMDSTGNRRST
jgi:hypothetical protein